MNNIDDFRFLVALAVDLDKKKLEFVAWQEDGENIEFRGVDDYQTYVLPKSFFGEFSWLYFYEGMQIYVSYNEEEPVILSYLSKEATVKVVETPDIEKGSATARFVGFSEACPAFSNYFILFICICIQIVCSDQSLALWKTVAASSCRTTLFLVRK
jgi:hypothetical protein